LQEYILLIHILGSYGTTAECGVTQESDPATWDKLFAQWLSEGRPAYLATGTSQYSVHQLTTGDVAFSIQDAESMVGQSSLEGMR
jgi:hypothetical protein